MRSKVVFVVGLMLIWGCGDSGNQFNPLVDPVDSQLFGIYAIDQYLTVPLPDDGVEPDEMWCDSPTAPDLAPSFLALFNAFTPAGDEAVLAGALCVTRDDCLEIVDLGAASNYAFQLGDDVGGWRGGTVLEPVVFGGDLCSTRIQEHALVASGNSVSIVSTTHDVMFPPTNVNINLGMADCQQRNAVQPPDPTMREVGLCLETIEVEATLETSLVTQ